MAFTWSAELGLEFPVRPKRNEPLGFYSTIPTQNFLYRARQVVVPQQSENKRTPTRVLPETLAEWLEDRLDGMLRRWPCFACRTPARFGVRLLNPPSSRTNRSE